MTENFLHYIWLYKKFNLFNLHTSSGQKIEIIKSGILNKNSGPDFTMSKILIDGIEWNGNIEIHTKSSDWLKHKHENNDSYKNIILHVVYIHDKEIPSLIKNNIPTLELQSYIPDQLIKNHSFLFFDPFYFIPCEKLIDKYLLTPNFSISEHLYINKLQEKLEKIKHLYHLLNNNWEAVLATTLAYSFGLKINAEAFEQLFLSIDYKIIQKLSYKPILLEALFFGLTNNSFKHKDDSYSLLLKEEFNYLKSKFLLTKQNIELKYFRLRPSNFPTIRLSQFAHLLSLYPNLFSHVVESKSIDQYFNLLDKVYASEYWNNHYVFGKESKLNVIKKLSKSQKELIVLNSFIPIKFTYSLSIGKSMIEEIIDITNKIPAENNSVINKFKKLGFPIISALDSQAFLDLYKNKCSNKQCLTCLIGHQILK